MSTLVMIDGEIFERDQARVNVFDRGFLYGDSVFETVGTHAGVPVALDEHLARLERSAAQVHIELPIPVESLRCEVLRLLQVSKNPESYVRIMVTRGQGALGLDPGLAQGPLRVIIVTPLERPAPEVYARGIAAISYQVQRITDEAGASGAKVGNYLLAVLAMREARAQGAYEALIVDPAGNVLEGATSNVFAVVGGSLVTPPEKAGILPGITRQHLLEVARAQGVEVQLRSLQLPELLGADEVFISSSIREVLPVVSIDGQRIARGRPGSLTRALHDGYRARVYA